MITAEQARQIQDLHTAFVRRQSAKGVDGPVPAGRKEGSDYNQHFSILEASGADWDEYDRQVREILGLPPLSEAPSDFGAMRADLAGFDDEIERAFNVNQLRFKAGTAKGGEWRRMSDFAADLLKQWARGDGPDDPLGDNDFSESQLRTILKDFRAAAEAAGDRQRVARLTPPRAKAGEDPQTKVNRLKALLYTDVRDSVRGERAVDKPQAKFTLQGKAHRDLDVAVYRDKDGKPRLFRESEAGKRGGLVAKFDDLGELQAWAEENDEPRLAQWAAKERGADVPAAPAAKKATPAKKAPAPAKAPTSRTDAPQFDLQRAMAEQGVSQKELDDIRERIRVEMSRVSVGSESDGVIGMAAIGGDPTVRRFFAEHRDIYNHLAQEQSIDRAWDYAWGLRGGAERGQRTATRAIRRAVGPGNPIVIRRATESRLRQALEDGRLKTQFETGTSSGFLDTDLRADFEQMSFGLPKDVAPEKRPVYGYVAVGGLDKDNGEKLKQFGDIRIVLRDSARSKVTVSVGDSLDRRKVLKPMPIDEADWHAVQPSLADAKYDSPAFRESHYVEAQIHGGVRTGDIEEVVFGRQPEPATVAALDRAGVSWRVDGPAGPRKATPAKATDPALGLYSKAEVDKLGAGLDKTDPATQGVINAEGRRRVEALLTDIDQMVTDGGTDRALLARLDARRDTAPASAVDDLKAAVESGDRDRVRQTIADIRGRMDGGTPASKLSQSEQERLDWAKLRDEAAPRQADARRLAAFERAAEAKGMTVPQWIDSQLDGLTVRQKRARLKAMGFSPEQINELAPTAAMAKKAATPRRATATPAKKLTARQLTDMSVDDIAQAARDGRVTPRTAAKAIRDAADAKLHYGILSAGGVRGDGVSAEGAANRQRARDEAARLRALADEIEALGSAAKRSLDVDEAAMAKKAAGATPKGPRPSGLPTDRKLESGDFDDLADRITGKKPEQIYEIISDLNASELSRLARKFPGSPLMVPGALSSSNRPAAGLRIPDGLSIDERRRWLAERVGNVRGGRPWAWRSEDPDPDDIERAEDLDDEDEDFEDDEDDEPVAEMDLALQHYEPDVERAAGRDVTPGHDQLHHYWTRGEGLAKWVGSPKPWTTLVGLLSEHVPPEKAKVFASRWFIEVFGYAAGSDKNRVAHGHPPRGHVVGPG